MKNSVFYKVVTLSRKKIGNTMHFEFSYLGLLEYINCAIFRKLIKIFQVL